MPQETENKVTLIGAQISIWGKSRYKGNELQRPVIEKA